MMCEDLTKELASKSDLLAVEAELQGDIKALAVAQQESLQAAFDYREIATKGDIAEVKTAIAESKAETIKWVVGLIFMQTGVIVALMLRLAK